MASLHFMHVLIMLALAAIASSSSQRLDPAFYQKICPYALPTIKEIVVDAVKKERRMGASLLRLHFHDCFVNGCDGSLLLDDGNGIDSEKRATPNNHSARGFEVIDRIKLAVDRVCGRPVVSCADILAVVARDSVVALGGPTWEVPLGRRDSTTASRTDANNDIPSPFMDLPALLKNFGKQGLDARDLVALSGGHTIGFARCLAFRTRIHNDTNIDPKFALALRRICPTSGEDTNLAPLDSTTAKFDVAYFRDLIKKRGLLQSDQAIFNGGSTDGLVRSYSSNPGLFSSDFVNSMIKMGNLKPLTGKQGQIRRNCRRVN